MPREPSEDDIISTISLETSMQISFYVETLRSVISKTGDGTGTSNRSILLILGAMQSALLRKYSEVLGTDEAALFYFGVADRLVANEKIPVSKPWMPTCKLVEDMLASMPPIVSEEPPSAGANTSAPTNSAKKTSTRKPRVRKIIPKKPSNDPDVNDKGEPV